MAAVHLAWFDDNGPFVFAILERKTIALLIDSMFARHHEQPFRLNRSRCRRRFKLGENFFIGLYRLLSMLWAKPVIVNNDPAIVNRDGFYLA